ncbi:MAG: adenylate/guanylate cyclase domain-containing protein, partial [Verrucomicrobia bacterium]|nr:adenylate/guanylate cyclase domain-containing protein [Verrucomicrobiota bacterium]
MPRPRRTVSFRSLLTLTLLAVLTGSVVVLTGLSTFFGDRNFTSLTTTIAEQTLGRAESEIRRLLQKAVDQNRQAVRLLSDQPLGKPQVPVLIQYLGGALEAQPQLARLTLTLQPSGEFLQAQRLADGRIQIRQATRADDGQFDLTVGPWPWEARVTRVTRRVPASDLDAAFLPEEKLTNASPFWSGAYPWSEPGQPERWLVRLASPILDEDRNLRAIVSSSLDLEQLDEFLEELDGQVPGYVAVFERGEGNQVPRLIGHPPPGRSGNVPNTTAARTALDPAMDAYFRAINLDPKTSGPHRDNSEYARLFRVDGIGYFGSFNDLELPSDPPWVIAMVLPVSEVAGGVMRNLRWALLAAAAFLTLGAVIAYWIALRISRPMRQLGADARAMSRLDFSTAPRPMSAVREVRELEQALTDARLSLRSFRKYVPADVVRLLMESGDEARLGGRTARLTLLFSDISNFTPIAETTEPQRLVEQLGEYLAAVSAAIHAHRGVVDKFIGDGVMAFWGAPQPDPHQALAAARAALEIQQRLDRLNARWAAEGRPVFPTRIGLHSGDAVVGNIGSEDRLNYTAIGDPVNLASRLESLNRLFG